MINLFYQKNGQITPFMLAIMVILIMAVMVSINIGKVSLTKTHTANATDAGALAGASAMANVFNMIAVANNTLRPLRTGKYWIFFATVSGLFGAAGRQLFFSILPKAYEAHSEANTAISKACGDPCGAISNAHSAAAAANAAIVQLGDLNSGFIGTINGIFFAITAFYLDQWNFYNGMRDNALNMHNSAVKLAFQLAFSNSGIAQQLIPGSAPEPPRGNTHNYQARFNNFMNAEIDALIRGNPAFVPLSYAWIDGQNRRHRVDVNVTLKPPEKYEVRVTVLPYPAEKTALTAIAVSADLAKRALRTAKGSYAAAVAPLQVACNCKRCSNVSGPVGRSCRVCVQMNCRAARSVLSRGSNANSAAIIELTAISAPLIAAEAGIAHAGTSWKENVTPFVEPDILAWIEDVGSSENESHDGLVYVETKQSHQGADLGLWQTQYPEVNSFSKANFIKDKLDNHNRGKINPPEPKYEASIVQTD